MRTEVITHKQPRVLENLTKICTHQINCLSLDVTVIYIKIYKFHEMYLWHYLETKRAVIICNSTVSFTKEILPNDNRNMIYSLNTHI